MGGLHCNVCASCHCVLQGGHLCCCCSLQRQPSALALCPTTPALALFPCRGRHSWYATTQKVCAVRLHGTTCMHKAGAGTAAVLFKAAWPSVMCKGQHAMPLQRNFDCSCPGGVTYLWEGLMEAEVAAMRFVHNQGHLPSVADLSYACSRHVWLLASREEQMNCRQSMGVLHRAPKQIAQNHKVAPLPACWSTCTLKRRPTCHIRACPIVGRGGDQHG